MRISFHHVDVFVLKLHIIVTATPVTSLLEQSQNRLTSTVTHEREVVSKQYLPMSKAHALSSLPLLST
jgi:hypothetical protein